MSRRHRLSQTWNCRPIYPTLRQVFIDQTRELLRNFKRAEQNGLAGLCAQGESTIGAAHQIDKGYERIDERLRQLGARIERVSA